MFFTCYPSIFLLFPFVYGVMLTRLQLHNTRRLHIWDPLIIYTCRIERGNACDKIANLNGYRLTADRGTMKHGKHRGPVFEYKQRCTCHRDETGARSPSYISFGTSDFNIGAPAQC